MIKSDTASSNDHLRYLLQFPHVLAVKLKKMSCTLSFRQTPLMYLINHSNQWPGCISHKQRNHFCFTVVAFWGHKLFALHSSLSRLSQNKGEQCAGAEVTAEKVRKNVLVYLHVNWVHPSVVVLFVQEMKIRLHMLLLVLMAYFIWPCKKLFIMVGLLLAARCQQNWFERNCSLAQAWCHKPPGG